MKFTKLKFLILVLMAISFLFFSNDFGLIDIEKEAIITAIAIDFTEDSEYEITAQIAVPEASNTTTENTKAQITGKGNTIGNAIKNTGDISGWYPQLAFCNLIIIGNEIAKTNIINVLDYFAKTLRIQDSAQVVVAEKKAKELLQKTTPLDNISSFAIQKILFKNPGFDADVASNDIKSFCSGYYSHSSSSFMPMIKLLTEDNSPQPNSGKSGKEGSNKSESQESESKKGKNFFDASSTALFYQGVKVGELDKDLTHAFNMLWRKTKGTTIPVSYKINDNTQNYLIKVLRCTPKIKMVANNESLQLVINLDLFCRVLDHNSSDDQTSLSNNKPLNQKLVKETEALLEKQLLEIVEVSKQTNCDFLNVKDKLYRFCHKHYARYKDNYLAKLTPKISVKVSGQK